MIIINSPQNPTGGVLTEDDLKVIADLAIKNDLWVFQMRYIVIWYTMENLKAFPLCPE